MHCDFLKEETTMGLRWLVTPGTASNYNMLLTTELNCKRQISGLPSLLYMSEEVNTGDFLARLAGVCSACM